MTKEKFMAYEDVRSSGILNMYDARVRDLADLTREEHIDIMKNYSEYAERYMGKDWKEKR